MPDTDEQDTSLLNTNVNQLLANPSIENLEDFINRNKDVLNFTREQSILNTGDTDEVIDYNNEIKAIYYEFLNKDLINSQIQENNLFINNTKLYGKDYNYYPTQSSNKIIEDIDLSYFVNDGIKYLLFYLQFLEQFNRNITQYLQDNYKIDSNIYNHNFEVISTYSIDGDTDKVISLEKSYKVVFKLDKEYFISDNVQSPIIFDDSIGTDTQRLSISQMLIKNDLIDLKRNLNIVNTTDIWSKTKTGYVKYESLKLHLYHLILVLIYSYISDHSWINKRDNLIPIINIYNKLVNNKKLIYQSELRIIRSSNEKISRVTEESDKIKEAIQTTKKLKNINNAIQDNSSSLKYLNNSIGYEKTKLNKINIVFIISILLFIFLSILLLSVKYVKSSSYIYLETIITIILYIIIYNYISSIKNASKIIAETFSMNHDNILRESDSNILALRIEGTNILSLSNENTNSYYDIINPLLNNELKHFNNKRYNNNLYDKIGQFNLNVSKRDVKYNIETIIFLMNISLLICLLIFSIYLKPDFIKIYGVIGLIIFILLAIVYFARILRVVRTKSNNFYWNKPIKEKDI